MSNRQRLIFLTAAGGNSSIWLRVGLTVTVIAVGVILLLLGFVIALAVVAAAICALLPVAIRRWFARSRRPEGPDGPATIEGEYVIASQDSVVPEDEVPGRNSVGDAERPDGPMR